MAEAKQPFPGERIRKPGGGRKALKSLLINNLAIFAAESYSSTRHGTSRDGGLMRAFLSP
jgi:hypothetical protein